MPVKIDMDMPQNCRGCKILNRGFCAVGYMFLTTEEFDSDERAVWCPLKECE